MEKVFPREKRSVIFADTSLSLRSRRSERRSKRGWR
jgi:hypothetical protein